jgi:chemotaxis protein methyltransferase CheR
MNTHKITRNELYTDGIADEDFARFSALIYDSCGIKMPPHKKSMLETRLRKRIRALNMSSFDEYSHYLFSSDGMSDELVNLIDVVTTNKTDFFREAAHFDYLTGVALPNLLNSSGAGIRKPLRIWSAGCSTGEEAYTLAMVLSEFAATVPNFQFSILATDISTQVLEKARLGIYPVARTEIIPTPLKKKYLMRGTGEYRDSVRIVPELRSRVTFRHLNFMDKDFRITEPIDIIFFRNVMIYFDRQTQEKLLSRFGNILRPDRYLFLGHSETLNGLSLPFSQEAPSVYRVA